jgi:Tfp pilus assembly protein FimV
MTVSYFSDLGKIRNPDRTDFSLRRYINFLSPLEIMRGRWASAAIGAGVARRRAGAEMEQQNQANQAQQQQAQQQIEAQQRQIEALQQQKQSAQPQQEDPTAKLKKYADLKQQGIISEEEYQKLKADLLSKI